MFLGFIRRIIITMHITSFQNQGTAYFTWQNMMGKYWRESCLSCMATERGIFTARQITKNGIGCRPICFNGKRCAGLPRMDAKHMTCGEFRMRKWKLLKLNSRTVLAASGVCTDSNAVLVVRSGVQWVCTRKYLANRFSQHIRF